MWTRSGARKEEGTVVGTTGDPRSYLVDTPTGQLRRNRRDLKTIPSSEHMSKQEQEELHANDQEEYKATRRSPIKTRSRTGTPINPPDRLYC